MGMLELDGGLRLRAVRRGRWLEYFTIAYNSLEGLIAILAGWLAGSIALVGFGVDSAIEVASGAALLYRLYSDADLQRRERTERTALRIVGVSFIALAVYVAYESAGRLLHREPPAESLVGIVLAAVSVIVMPLVARSKRRVAREISSNAMAADAKQTEFCMYLSAILLAGLSFNAAFGWWWADPLAGLAMVPIIAQEGVRALRGRGCSCHCG